MKKYLLVIPLLLVAISVYAVDYYGNCNAGTCYCYQRGGNCLPSICTAISCSPIEYSTCTNNCTQTRTSSCDFDEFEDCTGTCGCDNDTGGKCSCTCNTGYTYSGGACVPSGGSSCTYSGSGNWAIDCKDKCNLSSTVVTGNITIYSTANGWVNFTTIASKGIRINATNSCIVWYTNKTIS